MEGVTLAAAPCGSAVLIFVCFFEGVGRVAVREALPSRWRGGGTMSTASVRQCAARCEAQMARLENFLGEFAARVEFFGEMW